MVGTGGFEMNDKAKLRMRPRWRSALTAICVAGVVACDSPGGSQDADCHRIGTLNPLTGDLGSVGVVLENAAKLAVADVNAAGKVAGKTLCLEMADTRTDEDTVAATVQSLIDDKKILALNGAAASAASLAAADVTKAKGVAQVSCCSTTIDLSTKSDVFRTVPSDALQGVVLAEVARGLTPAAANVAVIYRNDSYGESLKGVFEAAFVARTGTITHAVPYAKGKSFYTDVVQAALANPVPDHVVLIAFPESGAQIMGDWQTSGLAPNVKWLGTDGLKKNTFVTSAGGAARGLTGTAPLLRGAHYAGFESRYKATYGGEAPGIFASNQYDAVILIALGIARAGEGATTVAIRDAIREVSRPVGVAVSADDLAAAITAAAAGDVDYSGVAGEVDIDDNGDVVSNYRVWLAGDSAVDATDECWACQDQVGNVTCDKLPSCS